MIIVSVAHWNESTKGTIPGKQSIDFDQKSLVTFELVDLLFDKLIVLGLYTFFKTKKFGEEVNFFCIEILLAWRKRLFDCPKRLSEKFSMKSLLKFTASWTKINGIFKKKPFFLDFDEGLTSNKKLNEKRELGQSLPLNSNNAVLYGIFK